MLENNSWLNDVKVGDEVGVRDYRRETLSKVIKVTSTQIVLHPERRFSKKDGRLRGTASAWRVPPRLFQPDDAFRKKIQDEENLKRLRRVMSLPLSPETVEAVLKARDESLVRAVRDMNDVLEESKPKIDEV